MIQAVKAINRLMLTEGLPEKTARWRYRVSKASYDHYNEMLRNGSPQPQLPVATGKEPWICPRCGKVNAPFMPWCDCRPS